MPEGCLCFSHVLAAQVVIIIFHIIYNYSDIVILIELNQEIETNGINFNHIHKILLDTYCYGLRYRPNLEWNLSRRYTIRHCTTDLYNVPFQQSITA